MKKSGLTTVYGLPTLLTVLIVMSVVGFASLSVMTSAAQHRGMLRSLNLLESSYDALAQAQIHQYDLTSALDSLIAPLSDGADQTAHIALWAQNKGLVYDVGASTVTLTHTTTAITVTTVLWISPTHTADNVRVLTQTTRIDNDQDYTQDGDPIWKGPQ
jgi:hypothetical protein